MDSWSVMQDELDGGNAHRTGAAHTAVPARPSHRWREAAVKALSTNLVPTVTTGVDSISDVLQVSPRRQEIEHTDRRGAIESPEAGRVAGCERQCRCSEKLMSQPTDDARERVVLFCPVPARRSHVTRPRWAATGGRPPVVRGLDAPSAHGLVSDNGEPEVTGASSVPGAASRSLHKMPVFSCVPDRAVRYRTSNGCRCAVRAHPAGRQRLKTVTLRLRPRHSMAWMSHSAGARSAGTTRGTKASRQVRGSRERVRRNAQLRPEWMWHSERFVRVRITENLSGSIDGIQLDRFRVGEVYEVGTSFGSYLLATGQAVPALDEPSPGLNHHNAQSQQSERSA
jgi:hypothetical protein